MPAKYEKERKIIREEKKKKEKALPIKEVDYSKKKMVKHETKPNTWVYVDA